MNNFELNDKALLLSDSLSAYNLAKKLILAEEQIERLKAQLIQSQDISERLSRIIDKEIYKESE